MSNQRQQVNSVSYSKALFNTIRSSRIESSSSISCSSSETFEDIPSTSHYSTDIMKSSKEKSRKKERVKEYLKELKTMVNHEKPKGSRAGTLSTLEQVVNSMRKIKAKQMEAEIRSQTQFTDVESGFYSNYTTPTEESTTHNHMQIEQQDQFLFVLSPWTGTIENISPNVKDVLGYPWDLLLGRPMSDFIGHQDQAVLRKLISPESADMEKAKNAGKEETPASDNQKTYLSFRMYKSLVRGFRISPGNHFLPFEVKYAVRNLHKEESGLLLGSLPPGLISRGKQTCVILKCTPLKTVYKGPQCVPEVRSFTTRHDDFFNATDMHPNAISLLGYLPQEFENSSMFDYYHVDDLPELYNTYQTLVSSEGKHCKSKPYRLRVKNGDYILVDTEWSALMKSPKSHGVKAVICQHTVMRGPNNPNVFEVTQWFNKPEVNIAHVSKLREKIKKLFTQNSDRVKLETQRNAIFSLEKMPDSVSEFQAPGHVCTPGIQEGPSSTPYESSLTYEHLNYKTSIRRFLLSQPKTYSSEESEKKSSDSHNEDASDLSDEMIEAFPVDFAIPKPPSYGSSIKVLVSEQEPREDVLIASPIREEMTEETPCPVINKFMEVLSSDSDSEPQPAYLPVTLTQEMLRTHTKMQEKLYVQQATKDNTNIPSTYSPMHLNTAPTRHKRFHPPELDSSTESHLHAAKSPRTIKPIHNLIPSFQPMDTSQAPSNQFHPNQFPSFPSEKFSKMSRGITPDIVNMHGLHGNNFGMSFPLAQLNALNLPTTTCVTNGSGVQWPYYSAAGGSGLPYYHYTPVSLYKPCSNAVYTQATLGKHGKCAQHLTTQTTTSSSSVSSFLPVYERKKLQPTRKQLVAQAQQKKGKGLWESSDNTSSAEDTTSSSLYLLESDSYNCSSYQDDQDHSTPKLQHRLPELPPWVLTCKSKWTKETEMCYTMPKRSLARVLKEDREKLLKMQQEDTCYQQLHEFLDEIDNPNFTPIIDEEYEALMTPREDGADVEKLMEGFTEIVVNDQTLCGGCDPEHNHGVSTILQPKKTKLKLMKDIAEHLSEEEWDSDRTLKECEEKLDDSVRSVVSGSPSPCKSSDFADMDSTTSKYSGDLTPSDLRSNEEADSSLKESDSKEESDTSSRDQKDQIFSPFPEINFFERIFVPLKLHFSTVCPFSKKSQLPSWLMEANFNKDIQMKYQLKTRSLDEVLARDQKISEEMRQPSPVIVQFAAYKKELKKEQLNRKATFWATSSSTEMSNTEPCKKELRNVIFTELMGSMMKQLDSSVESSKEDTSKNEKISASDSQDMVGINTDNLASITSQSVCLTCETSTTESNKEPQWCDNLNKQCENLNEQLNNCQSTAPQGQSDVVVEEATEFMGHFDEMFQEMFEPEADGDLYDLDMYGD